jgi:3-isopropylmalate dehydrogenase
MKMRIAVLPGDGIGPEVTSEAVRVLSAVADMYDHCFEFSSHAIGGSAIKEFGLPFPNKTADACLSSDAVFLGAVGAPEFDGLPASRRPEYGLLQLRQTLGGFANLRPAISYPGIIGVSPLRAEIIRGADVLIVRELLGGLYFGEPRGFIGENGNSAAVNTLRYSVEEIERVARLAFQAAAGRQKLVTSVDKANVLETSQLWRETVSRVAADYPEVQVKHMYVDACALHLMTNPRSFDVILTENLFGDILSDEAAVITGSLGMLASATIGGAVNLYEPVHGSAPDLAGRGVANPLGAIASAAMLLRYSGQLEQEAADIETAIDLILDAGYRTPDIDDGNRGQIVSTSEVGALIADAVVQMADARYSYHAV